MSTAHVRPGSRYLGAMILAGLVAVAVAESGGSLAAQQKERRKDNPGEAAAFRALVAGGGSSEKLEAAMAADEKAAPAQKLKFTPRPVPPDALPKAITRVREMRGEVAANKKVPITVMSKNAAQGRPTRVAGVPVGPLPGQEVTLPNGQLVVRPVMAPLATSNTLDPSGWKWKGPGNIGGRTRAIVVHPTNPLVYWLGGVAGGIWKTTDAGATWYPLNDFMASVAVSCMVLDTSDPEHPETLYAGTGEGFYNGDAIRGFGIFVSRDGGVTWNQLPATATDDFRFVNRIAVTRTATGSTLLVATQTGLFRSTDQGGSFAKVVGTMGNTRLLDVKFHPSDPQKCVASGVGQAMVSADNGQTWNASAGLPTSGRVELTYAAANGDVVYASVDVNGGAIYRSLNGGTSYALRSTPKHLVHEGSAVANSQGWYSNCIWAGDPTNPNLVVIGGIDLHRSTNAGQAFTKISDWTRTQQSPHADHHIIVSHANYDGVTNKSVFCGNDGGIYRADNIAAVTQLNGWQELNNGLGITQFYGVAVHTSSGNITGGTQDNGTLFFTAGGDSETWKEIYGGDGGYSDVDSDNDFYYGEYIALTIHRSKSGTPSVDIYQSIGDAGSNALFIAPFVLDPNDSKTLYAGGARLWRTKDATANNVQFQPLSGAVNGDAISAIAVAKGDSKNVWIGFANGNAGPVYKSAATGPAPGTWTKINGLPTRYVTRIVIDPSNPKTVYVMFGGYNADNLWKSEDSGMTWAAIGNGVLPAVPVLDLEIHPDSPKFLYLGTEVGLFVSDDGGVTWNPTNQGPTNAPAQRLCWMGKTLVVGTHGRGVFTIDLSQAVNPPGPVPKPAVPIPQEPGK